MKKILIILVLLFCCACSFEPPMDFNKDNIVTGLIFIVPIVVKCGE